MPLYKDFSTLAGRGSLELEVPGWREKLVIEFGYEDISRASYLHWRIQGTEHTFMISYYDIMSETQGRYEEHFRWFLQDFRKEYISWIYEGLSEPWMREYHEQYKYLVEL
jgi:hypothetical protein